MRRGCGYSGLYFNRRRVRADLPGDVADAGMGPTRSDPDRGAGSERRL
jgi:hypothetical protein